MSGNISFTGLNSSFDSGALIQQLVDIETQSRVQPLQIKKQKLQAENTFLDSALTAINKVGTALKFNSVIKGTESLAPKKITSSDAENKFLNVTTTDIAVPQNFKVQILQMATNTLRKSASSLSLGIDSSTQLTNLNLKGFSDIKSGSVTIAGETLDYTEAGKTILKSATELTPPATINESTILDEANFKEGVNLTSGTITINGQEQTFALDTETATVQDLLDFFKSFSGITNASLNKGRIKLDGINSLSSGSSNLVDALGLDSSKINKKTLTADHDITEHTLADWGITGSDLTINGVQINFAANIANDPAEYSFDPNTTTMTKLINAINKTSATDSADALNLTASFSSSDNKFLLTNNVASTDSINVSSSNSNLVTVLDLNDETLGTDNALSNVLTFLESFAAINSATLVNGKIQLDGSLQSLGSPGDVSNMLAALGLKNAKIDTALGSVTGVQNLDAPESTTKLSELGVTGDTLTINGAELSYELTDTLQDLVNKINNKANTKISATYDSLSGDIKFTNEDTGALSLTVSSNGNLSSILHLDDPAGETLGKNAEFTISTLNDNQTLVSNSNTITGLIEGVTINATKVTTDPVSITIAKDATGYQTRITGVITSINDFIKTLNKQNDSFSRSLVGRLKNALGSIPGDFGNDTFTSFVNVGLSTELDGNGKFVGYKLDAAKFKKAYEEAPDQLNKLLWGNSEIDSKFSLLNSGKQGVFATLNDIIKTYTDASQGIIKQVRSSITTQIKTQDDRISRAQDSVENMRARLVRQFSQLDVVNSQYQQQQAALQSSGLI